MELGQKLKQARLEAGLSQRQLCGDTITRNMLSQIENGSARPSMATLKVLCSRLGKPLGYFVENEPSENLALLHRAAHAEPGEALELLKGYLSPDPMLEDWYHWLYAKCHMALAKQAAAENRMPYAISLLKTAAAHTACQELTLLQYETGMGTASELREKLADNTAEMLLRGAAAYERGDYDSCLCCLKVSDSQPLQWKRLYADSLIALERYHEAIEYLLQLEETKEICGQLELCYHRLKNFEKAYEYACKQR